MWLRTPTIGLLAVAAQSAAPDAPATARSSPRPIPPISVHLYAQRLIHGSSAACYHGFGGQTVWVTVDGVSSNQIAW